ncbi:phosphatase PAP2 family protein [Pedobacter sp. MC2016-14]|uniref:phosphatase PAP2 family protein n=1 Tax=Pedobacter sp. MC2016-14 TaxID=2897327 RepID=UPI001E592445|nr:phosphatase PAP2 family protein [Pedobacter sp. MC2016-14]MCD0487822.1 phosphatase PAP2 family protein [Pedobacter sp. MC2016-14]
MKRFSFFLALCLPAVVFAQEVKPLNTDTATKSGSMILRSQNLPAFKSFIVPGVLIGYGLLSLGNNPIRSLDYSTRAELQEDHPRFAMHLDNYLQYSPGIAFYGLNLLGVKSKHSVADGTALFLLSEAIMTGSVFAVKKLADRARPDGADNFSFPSGHTANAFAAAEFLNQEYRDVSPWIGYAGYTVATATGALRMYNNKHWFSDVVAGAGFGIASTKLAYLLYPHLKKLVIGKADIKYSMVPMYQHKTAGILFRGAF